MLQFVGIGEGFLPHSLKLALPQKVSFVRIKKYKREENTQKDTADIRLLSLLQKLLALPQKFLALPQKLLALPLKRKGVTIQP
jgi:hypothetical protein